MRRGLPRLGVILALTGGLAACGAQVATVRPTGFAPAGAKVGVTVGAQAGAPSAATPACSDATVRASLKPTGPLPAPGKITTSNAALTAILKKGYLTAGVAQDTLLFGYRNSMTGVIEGFDIDMLRQVAMELFGDPNKLRLQVIGYKDRVPDVKMNKVDIVADTMTINCTRENDVDFSTVYYDAGQKVLVQKGATAKSVKDLAGKRVCATAGSTSVDNLKNLPLDPPIVIDTVATQADCLVEFQLGNADAISTDDTILIGLAAQDPYASIIGDRFTDEPYGMAVSKTDPDLTRLVNGVLEKIRADGTWTKIYQTWLGKYITGPAPAPPVAQYRSGS